MGAGNIIRMVDRVPGPRPETPSRVDILGVKVSAVNPADAIRLIETWIAKRTPQYVCVTGVHGIMESRAAPRLRAIHNDAGLVTPDGMPLVWLGRWSGSAEMDRVYGPDLMRALLAMSPKRGYRHFFYGGAPGIADRLASQMRIDHPGLKVVGTLSPPYRPLSPAEDAQVIEQINSASPDIVWVGLSTPKQEYWMAAHRNQLTASVLIGVGAAFDFLSGVKKQAPRWMQRSGLEWLFRLSTEPRRLWRRYFRIVPGFIALISIQMLKSGRTRPLSS